MQCKHCRKHFRWTRFKCPSCRRRNPRSPGVLAFFLLTVAVTCTAIWFIFKAAMLRDDAAAGVVPAGPEEESVLKRMFRTPEPAKTDDVRFNQ